MVSTRTCDYSGEEIEPGTGTMYVKTDGTILHFKDSKAEKNYFLGREARDLEWTQEGQAAGGETQPEPTPEPEPEPEPEAEADAETEDDAESTAEDDDTEQTEE